MKPSLNEPVQQATRVIREQNWFDSIKKTAFIVGSALFVFIALRNSVVWHLQRFWGASADFWERYWDKLYSLSGRDEFSMAVIGSFLVTFCVFWGFNSFLLFIDVTGSPKFLTKYRIQEGKNEPVDKQKLKKALITVLFNQTVIGIPIALLAYPLMQWRGVIADRSLPTFQWVVFEIGVFTLVEELMFYYSHRLLHHKSIYKYIHKTHHEWTAPIGIIGIYAHPIEHVISNLIPPLAGPILMGSHLATTWMWFALALVSTSISHCGYHFPLLPSPEAHDFHHLKFTNNFGVLGILDRLHGTDTQFRATKAYQRHLLLLGTVPLSVEIPEDSKKWMKAD